MSNLPPPPEADDSWLTALVKSIRAISAETNPALHWKIGAGAELARDLKIDPLGRQSIACALDEALGIAIPDSAIESWVFVSDLARTVQELTKAKGESA